MCVTMVGMWITQHTHTHIHTQTNTGPYTYYTNTHTHIYVYVWKWETCWNLCWRKQQSRRATCELPFSFCAAKNERAVMWLNLLVKIKAEAAASSFFVLVCALLSRCVWIIIIPNLFFRHVGKICWKEEHNTHSETRTKPGIVLRNSESNNLNSTKLNSGYQII